jgi:anti-anti-sigma factor
MRIKGFNMSLDIGQREAEGIIILDLNGPLTLGQGDGLFRDRVAVLRQSGKVNIVLNFKGVSDIDSTGLGTLVFGLAKLRNAGGGLALVNVNQSHVALFLLIKLAMTFEFFADEHDAVNSFFRERVLKPFDILDFVQHEEARVLHRELRSEVAC